VAHDDTYNVVYTKRHLGNDPNIFKKGVYPYEYVTCPEILNEACLPQEKIFIASFNEEGISEEQYDRALYMW